MLQLKGLGHEKTGVIEARTGGNTVFTGLNPSLKCCSLFNVYEFTRK